MYFNDEFVQMLKEKYPEGTRVVVDHMEDPRPIPSGTVGTVRHVDDIGTIHCDFDNGRKLGLIPGEDSFHIEVEKKETIRVVLCDPGKKARVTTVKNDLKALQNMVDGPIECVYPYADPVGIICNEEGKLERLEPNRSLRDDQGKIYDVLVGRFMVVGLGYEDFDSLSDALCEKYVKLFEYPELFYREGNEIKSIKVEMHEMPRRSKGR